MYVTVFQLSQAVHQLSGIASFDQCYGLRDMWTCHLADQTRLKTRTAVTTSQMLTVTDGSEGMTALALLSHALIEHTHHMSTPSIRRLLEAWNCAIPSATTYKCKVYACCSAQSKHSLVHCLQSIVLQAQIRVRQTATVKRAAAGLLSQYFFTLLGQLMTSSCQKSCSGP